jgi:hypothetical protein
VTPWSCNAFATAMLAADPDESGVYFVDDHFVPSHRQTAGARATTPNAATPNAAAPTP